MALPTHRDADPAAFRPAVPPIVTLTINPCVDESAAVDQVVPDRKLRCGPPRYEPGGGGINVARAIQSSGARPWRSIPPAGAAGEASGSAPGDRRCDASAASDRGMDPREPQRLRGIDGQAIPLRAPGPGAQRGRAGRLFRRSRGACALPRVSRRQRQPASGRSDRLPRARGAPDTRAGRPVRARRLRRGGEAGARGRSLPRETEPEGIPALDGPARRRGAPSRFGIEALDRDRPLRGRRPVARRGRGPLGDRRVERASAFADGSGAQQRRRRGLDARRNRVAPPARPPARRGPAIRHRGGRGGRS